MNPPVMFLRFYDIPDERITECMGKLAEYSSDFTEVDRRPADHTCNVHTVGIKEVTEVVIKFDNMSDLLAFKDNERAQMTYFLYATDIPEAEFVNRGPGDVAYPTN